MIVPACCILAAYGGILSAVWRASNRPEWRG